MRPLRALLLLAAFVAVTACAPVATGVRDAFEKADGASVEMLTDGVGFTPGGQVAEDTILIVLGDDLTLIEPPSQGTCEDNDSHFDCRLGTVEDPIVVLIHGQNRYASVNFRRPGSSTVYRTTGR